MFEFPDFWSETAREIAIKNYFLKGETSLKQLVDRIVNGVGDAARQQKIDSVFFKDEKALVHFLERLSYFLTHQVGAFNSPVWFNLGVSKQPQVSACFIQSVNDSIESIYGLLESEARLFRLGSGSGTNFSKIPNVMPILEVFDKSAQIPRSGGGHRRAAKMVCLDSDHPQIHEFIQWKVKEEKKARALIQQGYSSGMDGEALRSVSGQNSNNSVRVTDQDMQNNSKLIQEMAHAAHESADPGIHFSDTISKWHTCKASGPIRASNPCSEFMFLDNSACNLASLNLIRFYTPESGFDFELFDEAIEIFLKAQEILVDYGSYPTTAIGEITHTHRPLGLGYTNLGGLLMAMGLPYDSQEGRHWAKKITERLHLVSLKISCELAQLSGPFPAYRENAQSLLDVMKLHEEQAEFFKKEWSLLLKDIQAHGVRNAQVTLIAPTGTIGLFMDCATLGIEPEFSLIKVKSLSGGGAMKLSNPLVAMALQKLGYSLKDQEQILESISQYGHPYESPYLKKEHHQIFYTAVPPQKHPEARVSADGHLLMMAAVQPFLSGAISKTVNLPSSATDKDVENLFRKAHKLGLKSLSIYRDGSKVVQPLVCVDC